MTFSFLHGSFPVPFASFQFFCTLRVKKYRPISSSSISSTSADLLISIASKFDFP